MLLNAANFQGYSFLVIKGKLTGVVKLPATPHTYTHTHTHTHTPKLGIKLSNTKFWHNLNIKNSAYTTLTIFKFFCNSVFFCFYLRLEKVFKITKSVDMFKFEEDWELNTQLKKQSEKK